MAKKKNQPTRTKLEEINDSLSGIEQKFEQHKKIIYWIVGAVLVVALAFWAYMKFGYGKEVERAKAEIAKADKLYLDAENAVQDSIEWQKRLPQIADNPEYLRQAKEAFEKPSKAPAMRDNALQIYEAVAKKYGHNLIFKNGVGNRAKLMAGILLSAKGKEAEAQKYLEEFSPKGKIVGPMSQILLGDTYVNQGEGNYDKALKAYDEAISQAQESFWERISWREIVLFILALAAIVAIVIFARKKDDPKLRRLILIISAVIFVAAAGLLTYLLISNKGFENRALIPYAMQKKAIVLDAQGKYDEEIKIYEEIEAKYYGPGSMSMQIEYAKGKGK